MTLKTGSMLHGRYRIESLLGQGGMGAVYKGFDTLYDVCCAIKEFCLGHLPDEEQIQNDLIEGKGKDKNILTREKATRQFKREAKLLASFNHPNLPKVTDYFAMDDEYYLVMNLIEGQNLLTILETNHWNALPTDQILRWIKQVIDALEYCHHNGVIHRDIKPANIIVTNGNDKVYLVDFGIAKHIDAGEHGTSGMTQMLTPRYSPPEQYSGAIKTNEQSDIYSLGATIYTLITGQLPLEAITRATGIAMPEPSELISDIPERLNSVIMKAMHIQQNQRFKNLEEMRQAIYSEKTISIKTPALKGISLPPKIKGARLHVMMGETTGAILGADSTQRSRVYDLNDTTTKIGRVGNRKETDVDVDLTALDMKRIISHHHATIEHMGDQYFIVDDESRNGTWLNDEKLEPRKRYPINDGALLQFGSLKSRGIQMLFKLIH